MAARNRDLAWFAASACSRALASSACAARCSVMSRPMHCTSRVLSSPGPRDPPTRTSARRPPFRFSARSAASAATIRSGRCALPFEGHGTKRGADHCIGRDAEHAAERLVYECEPPLERTPGNDLGLIVQQFAIAGLVLADLPLQVLQAFDIAFEPLSPSAKRSNSSRRRSAILGARAAMPARTRQRCRRRNEKRPQPPGRCR